MDGEWKNTSTPQTVEIGVHFCSQEIKKFSKKFGDLE